MNFNEKEMRKLKEHYKKFNIKQYLKYGLSKNEILKLKEAFDLFDITGKGVIKLDDLKKGLNDLGDEIECHHALNNGTYVIVDIGTAYITNKYEKRLIEFFFDEI